MKNAFSKNRPTRAASVPLKITMTYLVVGGLWILLSDKFLGLIVNDPVILTQVSIIKGGLYVAATGLMLYALIARGTSQIQRSEEEARISEAKYRELVESANSIIMRRNVAGHVTFFNDFAQDFFGYSKDEILGKHVVGTIVPELDESGRNLKEMIEDIGKHSERYANNENENMRRNGERVWIAWTNKPIRDEHGQIVEVLCIGNDISDRKQAEEEMRKKEHKYRVLFETANDGIFLQGATGFVDCNQKGASMYGLTREDLIGRSPAELSPKRQPDGRLSSEVAAEKILAAFNGEPQAFEWQSLRVDGAPFDVEITLNRVEMGGSVLLQAIVRDITDRKRVQEALRASEGRFRVAWETSPDALTISNLRDGTYVDVNSGYTFLTGYSREEVVGKSALDIPFWADPLDRQPFASALVRDGHVRNYETRLRRKDGETRTVLISAGLMNLEGDPHLLAVTRDIEEIKRAEEALRASEDKYRRVVENANDAIFIAQEGFIKFPNPQLAVVSGYTMEELVQQPFLDFVYPDDRELVATMHQKRMQGEEAPATYSFRVVDKSGSILWMQLSSVFLSWEGRPASLNFLRDVTGEKRLESQLVHAQKMEAVGTLAGGIAHDFNNLLQAVQGYAELLLLSRTEGEEGHRELLEIRRAARRGGELTRQLLTFSRKMESKLQSVDLNRIVDDARMLLERTIPKMITIELHLMGNLHPVNADASQIEQVLMNLAVNARDAMPDGGTLRIETNNVLLDEESRHSQPELTPGDYVLLTVSDTGQGIDGVTLGSIFDPFFTTKEVGKGTGLGLAMVYGIVKNHHGHIMCSSQSSRGTTFSIYLPALEPVEMTPATVAGRQQARGGNETVLLVDDEDALRDLGKQILHLYGYTVIVAPDAETALQIYQEDKGRIDLVVLDLLMPGMGGAQCLEKILEIDPGAKIVIASGYSASGEAEKATESGAKAFIQKPYDVQEMLEVVRGVLEN